MPSPDPPEGPASRPGDLADLTDLTDRALDAVARGAVDQPTAGTGGLAGPAPPRPGDLLWADGAGPGELRRLTIMFCDLVGSTALSGRQDPERYRLIVGRYRRACRQVIEDRYDGHLADNQGDGLLALFGHPTAHEDDALRAVRAGLDIVAAVRDLSTRAEREVGEELSARVGVHHGLVYLDTDEDGVYGLAANVAARLHDLAPPGALVVSREVLDLVGDHVAVDPQEPAKVKGLDEPLPSWLVTGERADPVRRWAVPLVGRAAERDRLRAAWARRPAAVLVRGEAGTGKSRLVAAFTDEVRAEGAGVVELTGTLLHATTGYHPVRALIEARCGIGRPTEAPARLARLAPHLRRLGLDPDETVPLLATVLGVGPAAGYRPAEVEARKLHEAVAAACGRYLRAGLDGRPTVLVAEDVQWFDEPTRALLAGLVRAPAEGLLVTMTGRPGTGPPAAGVEVVELGPLLPAESTALVAALDPTGAVAGRHADLLARGDGIPLYLEELVRAALDPVAGAVPVAGPGPPAGEVPGGLHEPLLARLPATAADRRIAAVAAAVGREIDPDLLHRVLGADAADLDRTLDDLHADLILERSGRRLRFRHELVRQVAYEAQPPSARRGIHALIADALGGEPTDWVALAHHQERAGRFLPAGDAHVRAAGEARRRGGVEEALHHLDRAVELVAELPDGRARRAREVELLLQRGALAVSVQGNASPRAAADYRRCLDVATGDRSRPGVYRTLISLWGYYTTRGELARARLVLDRFATVATGEHAHLQLENDAGYAILDWFGGRFGPARAGLEEAADRARRRFPHRRAHADWTLPNDPCVAIHTHLAMARFMAGDPAGGADALATAGTYGERLGFPEGPFSILYSQCYASWCHLEQGHLDRAAASAERTRALAETHGFDFYLAAAATAAAQVEAARAGRDAGADAATLAGHARTLAGLVATWLVFETRLFLPTVVTAAGATLARAGDPEGARAHLDQSLALAAETGLTFYDAETLRLRAALEPDAAARRRALRAARARAEEQGAVPFRLRIARDLHALDGDRHELAAAVDRFAPGASYPELDAARAVLGR